MDITTGTGILFLIMVLMFIVGFGYMIYWLVPTKSKSDDTIQEG